MHTTNRKSFKGRQEAKQYNEAGQRWPKQVANTTTKNFGYKKWTNQNLLNKKLKVNHWSRNPREYTESHSHWCGNTTLTNQVLARGENDVNQ